MKFTLGEVFEIDTVLQRVTEERLEIKAAHAWSRIARLLGAEAKDFMVQRAKLFKEYGEPVEGKTDQIQIPADKLEAFGLKLEELMAIEVEVDVQPQELKTLVTRKYVDIDGKTEVHEYPAATPKDLRVLGALVKDA
jgi:hypothetical protein